MYIFCKFIVVYATKFYYILFFVFNIYTKKLYFYLIFILIIQKFKKRP